MDTYYAILNGRVIVLARAKSEDQARDQIELALAEEGEVHTDNLRIERLPRDEVTILDLETY